MSEQWRQEAKCWTELMRDEGYVLLPGRIQPAAVEALAAECTLLAAAHERACKHVAAVRLRSSEGESEPRCDDGDDSGSDGEPDDPLLDPFEHTCVPEGDAARIEPHAWLRLRSRALAGLDGPAGPRAIQQWEPNGGVLARLLLVDLPRLVADICAPGAGPCLLFGEHFICKRAHSTGRYAWHTDANEQLPHARPQSAGQQYVSVWLPLDRMSADNGCLALWPRSRPQPPDWARGACSDGDSAADWLEGPGPRAHGRAVLLSEMVPGDCVLFSADLWHCSGANATNNPRRAYQAQYLLPGVSELGLGGPSPLGFAVAPLDSTPEASG